MIQGLRLSGENFGDLPPGRSTSDLGRAPRQDMQQLVPNFCFPSGERGTWSDDLEPESTS